MDYNSIRRKTRKIHIGREGSKGLFIGGDAPISVQTMINVPTTDREGCLAQAAELQSAGADIIRITVPEGKDAGIFSYLHENGITVPLVADIHFDYRAAIESVAAGADKIRINPGNIGDASRVKQVAAVCSAASVPIRIGVNSGSCERSILEKYGAPTGEALYESAMYHVGLLTAEGFDDIVISVKSSDLRNMISAYRLISENTDYPLHLGVTEAGTAARGIIKSAIGIGSLLCDGIGDTIRVSLTASPLLEVSEGRKILGSVGVCDNAIEVVSCPTCGRTKVDLISIAEKFDKAVAALKPARKLKVAIMGCAVNGPGEAREADFGVACGDGCGLIFSNGEIIEKVSDDEIIPTLVRMCEAAEIKK